MLSENSSRIGVFSGMQSSLPPSLPPSLRPPSPFLTPLPSSKKESHFPGKKKSDGAAAVSVLLLLFPFGRSREIYDTRKLLGKTALSLSLSLSVRYALLREENLILIALKVP